MRQLFLHCFSVVRNIEVIVVRGVAGVDAVHDLHFVIGVSLQLFCRLARGKRGIGQKRLADVKIHAGLFAKEAEKPLAGAKGHRDGQNRLFEAYCILEHSFF